MLSACLGAFVDLQSTKMEALMEELHLMQERDPAAKALVFSQVRSRPRDRLQASTYARRTRVDTAARLVGALVLPYL